MSTIYKRVFGPCITVKPTSIDLVAGLPEGEPPGTKVTSGTQLATNHSKRREEHDATLSVYLTATGGDPGDFVEVATRVKIGSDTRNTGVRGFRESTYFEPPQLLITHWNIVGTSFYYHVKMWEADTWPNPDDTIINWEGQITIPSGLPHGYKKVTFGGGGDYPVEESGFEGFLEFKTALRTFGQPRPRPRPGTEPEPGTRPAHHPK